MNNNARGRGRGAGESGDGVGDDTAVVAVVVACVRETSLTLVSHPRREKGLLVLTPSTVWRALEL